MSRIRSAQNAGEAIYRRKILTYASEFSLAAESSFIRYIRNEFTEHELTSFKNCLKNYVEDRTASIVQLVDFTQDGFNKFDELWSAKVTPIFTKMMRCYVFLIRSHRPVTHDCESVSAVSLN